jgi:hypothetical protein
MAKRSAAGQIAHDKGVYLEAINLRRNGWQVLADHIPGFIPPPEIEGYVPDIYAVNGTKTLIIEIETFGEDDHGQHDAFRKYAENFESIKFEIWIVNAAGMRIGSQELLLSS